MKALKFMTMFAIAFTASLINAHAEEAKPIVVASIATSKIATQQDAATKTEALSTDASSPADIDGNRIVDCFYLEYSDDPVCKKK